MKKNCLILALCCLSFTTVFAQTFDVEFKNGETRKVIVEYNDPHKIAPGILSVHPIMAQSFGATQIFGGNITYDRIINKKMQMEGSFTHSYHSNTMILSIENHRSFFSWIKSHKRKIPVDNTYFKEGDRIMYVAKLPVMFLHSFDGDLGIGYYNIAPDMTHFNSPSTHLSSLSSHLGGDITRIRYAMINAGISFYMSNSIRVNVKDKKTACSSHSRVHFNLLYAVAGSYDYSTRYTDDKEPSLKRTGWKIGFHKYFQWNNRGTSLSLGIVYGMIPAYNFFVERAGSISPSYYNGISVGFGFGKNVSKHTP